MRILKILGRSLVDCFSHYVAPMVASGGDYAPAPGSLPAEAAQAFEQAMTALARMKPATARDHLVRATCVAPHFLGGRLLLGAVLSDLGDASGARDVLDRLLVESFEDGRLWFLSGQLAERCGEVDRAVECYESAMARGGRSACEAAERLAALHLATAEYEAACEKLEWLVEARPEEFCVRVELAAVLSALGRHHEAIRAYEDAILLEPDDWEAHKDLAAELEAEGRLSESLAELRLVLDEHPDFADLNLRAGKLCAKLSDAEGALHHADAALESNPRYLEAAILKGLLLIESGEFRASAAAFRRALEINESYLAAYAGLALALERSGRKAESVEIMRLAGTIAPGSEAVYLRLADAGLQAVLDDPGGAGQGDAPRTCSDRLGSDKEQRGAAWASSHDEKMQVLLEKHRSAVERHPRYADVRYGYGLLLSSLGRQSEALEQYRAAAEINPGYTEALVRLAVSYWHLGRPDEARHALEKAARTDARDLSAHYRFGVLWADRGLWPLMVEILRRRAAEGAGQELRGAEISVTANLGLTDTPCREYLASLNLSDHRDRPTPSPALAP